MDINLEKAAVQLFNKGIHELSAAEHYVLRQFLKRKPVARNVREEYKDQMSFGQRLADKVAVIGGSWGFIITFGTVMVCWVVLNSIVLARSGEDFDPYPYILLNLFLSMIASIQAPVIMMSQNRQAAKDRLDATHDYEVNLKAELEILELHRKMDDLREQQWAELLALQQEQILLLKKLLEARESDVSKIPSS
jgi:uncharacterized membrane protein